MAKADKVDKKASKVKDVKAKAAAPAKKAVKSSAAILAEAKVRVHCLIYRRMYMLSVLMSRQRPRRRLRLHPQSRLTPPTLTLRMRPRSRSPSQKLLQMARPTAR